MASLRGGRVVTSQPRPVTEEPVRGSVPPPWFFGLPGIERVSALAKGLIPRNPLGHLFGLNLGNVGAGTATVRMPASANFLGPPFMEVSPVLYVALWNAATTTIPAGFDVVPVTVSQQYFRPPRPQPGNLLARARTLNASSVFVCAMVEIEDPGRRPATPCCSCFDRPSGGTYLPDAGSTGSSRDRRRYL